jgi:hypothetical protein
MKTLIFYLCVPVAFAGFGLTPLLLFFHRYRGSSSSTLIEFFVLCTIFGVITITSFVIGCFYLQWYWVVIILLSYVVWSLLWVLYAFGKPFKHP